MKTNIRRKIQYDILKTNKNIIIGSLVDTPFTIEFLKSVTSSTKEVFSESNIGLTSNIYNLEIAGMKYNLKLKRKNILVKNIDGHLSFINEIQRRSELSQLRKSNSIIDNGIVKTIYANLNEGIILSEYIDGVHLRDYDISQLKIFFELLYQLDINGFFEWDLCKGNILFTINNSFKLFDFGYMYRFNPLIEFNNNGLNTPKFHPIERFETRTYIHILKKLENNKLLERYRELLHLKSSYFEKKLLFLNKNKGNKEVINFYETTIKTLHASLKNDESLLNSWKIHLYVTLRLEIEDDLSGKSCTNETLVKIDEIKILVKNNYELFNLSGIFDQEESQSLDQVLSFYNVLISEVNKYMIEY